MKKVLVIGATGAMGRFLVPYLAELGYSVTGVGLEENFSWGVEATYIQGNAFDRDFITKLLEEKFDGIVNFMCYNDRKEDWRNWYKLYLDNTEHYIFLSSCRVYADEEVPVKESSPRLLDVSKDPELLVSHDYCIYKARAEDVLFTSGYRNYTIVRPATTFSEMRFQLVTLEATHTVGRARKGKKVVLPIQAKDKPATLSWGKDVAQQIAHLLFKEEAMQQVFNVCSAESRTWGEIADYYKELCGLEAVWVDKEDYLKIVSKDGIVTTDARWQLEYARMFRRITDNSKVLAVTGLKQENCTSLYDALKMMIAAIPEDYVAPDGPKGDRMDKYLEEHGL